MGEFVKAAQAQEQIGTAGMYPLLQMMMNRRQQDLAREKFEYQKSRKKNSEYWMLQKRKWDVEDAKLEREWKTAERRKDRALQERITSARTEAQKKAKEATMKYREQTKKERDEYQKNLKSRTDENSNYNNLLRRQSDMAKSISALQDSISGINKDHPNYAKLQKDLQEATNDIMNVSKKIKDTEDRMDKLGMKRSGQGIPINQLLRTIKDIKVYQPAKKELEKHKQNIPKEWNQYNVGHIGTRLGMGIDPLLRVLGISNQKYPAYLTDEERKLGEVAAGKEFDPTKTMELMKKYEEFENYMKGTKPEYAVQSVNTFPYAPGLQEEREFLDKY